MLPKTILIAEDSSVIQNMAKKVLESQNFKILTAKNGEKVLEILSREQVDVLLLDLNMPVMNGVDCMKAVRALPEAEKAQIPIIAITGNAPGYTLDEFKEMGFNDYIPKPINFDLLISTVKKLTK
jgi:CheY-like chemotaxis protein